jgi:hypothetical protein
MDMTSFYLVAGAAAAVTALAAWRFSGAGGRRGRRWLVTHGRAPVAPRAGRNLARNSTADTAAALQAAQHDAASPPPLRLARQAAPPEPVAADTGLYIGSVQLVPLSPGAAAGAAPAADLKGPPQAAVLAPARAVLVEASAADEFMHWLADCILREDVAVNTPQAMVHTCSEGLVLAYPGIFERYLRAGGALGNAGAAETEARVKTLLTAVCEAGWHLRGLLNASLLHFQLDRPDEGPRFLLGLVIRSPQRFVPRLPRPNPALMRLL